jgi:hypothetical protein
VSEATVKKRPISLTALRTASLRDETSCTRHSSPIIIYITNLSFSGPAGHTGTPTLVYTRGIIDAMREASNVLGIEWIIGIPLNQSDPPRLDVVYLSAEVLGEYLKVRRTPLARRKLMKYIDLATRQRARPVHHPRISPDRPVQPRNLHERDRACDQCDGERPPGGRPVPHDDWSSWHLRVRDGVVCARAHSRLQLSRTMCVHALWVLGAL